VVEGGGIWRHPTSRKLRLPAGNATGRGVDFSKGENPCCARGTHSRRDLPLAGAGMTMPSFFRSPPAKGPDSCTGEANLSCQARNPGPGQIVYSNWIRAAGDGPPGGSQDNRYRHRHRYRGGGSQHGGLRRARDSGADHHYHHGARGFGRRPRLSSKSLEAEGCHYCVLEDRDAAARR